MNELDRLIEADQNNIPVSRMAITSFDPDLCEALNTAAATLGGPPQVTRITASGRKGAAATVEDLR